MTKIAVLVGSLREKSSNKMLAAALEASVPNVTFEYINIRLPLYNEDVEYAGIPSEVQEARRSVESAAGILLVTPEYNRSVPGVLKNAIDWLSRPYGQTSFAGKPVGIVGSSIGPVGTAVAQAELNRIMLFQDAKVLGQPEIHVANAGEVFDETGRVLSERWQKNFTNFMTVFLAWIARQ